MSKTPEEAFRLIEEMAENHNQWNTERGVIYKPAQGKAVSDEMRSLADQVSLLCSKVNSIQTASVPAITCENCGNHDHTVEYCRSIDQGSEHVNAIGNYNQSKSNDPYSNTYNPGWRNHPNLSWKNNNNAGGNNENKGYQKPNQNFNQNQNSNIENMLEKILANQNQFMSSQSKLNDEFKENFSQINSRLDRVETHTKMLENQIAQNASAPYRPPGKLPAKPETNPREHCNAIMTRSGKQLGEPRGRLEQTEKELNDREGELEIGESSSHKRPQACSSPQKGDEPKRGESCEENNPKSDLPNPYQPPIPFPQRLVQQKLDKKFGKFLEVFKKLYINVPILEAIIEMPSYAKFLKEILSSKKKLDDYGTCMVTLTEDCSAVIQNKLPPKLKDPGSFSVPCSIGTLSFDRALCDLGASVNLMPLSTYRKLNLGELKPTSISLQLADSSVKYPVGLLENIPVQIGEFLLPADFVILDMEENPRNPIILGRPLLATGKANIDVASGKITFDICDNKVEFSLNNASNKIPYSESCCSVETNNEEIYDVSVLFDEPSIDESNNFSEGTNEKMQKKRKPRRARRRESSRMFEQIERILSKFGYCFKIEPYVEKSERKPRIARSHLSVKGSS